MFDFEVGSKPQGKYCDGISRRKMLHIGGAGFLSGFSLPHLLQSEAEAATGRKARAKSCIMIFLEGGPSHIDMWDLKPNAPKEVRGPYNPISTKVPGMQIGNLMPHCSKVMDKVTILRSHSHRDNGHQTGQHWCMTGYPPNFADGQAQGVPYNITYPSIGSMVTRELGSRGSVPPYINMPNPLGPGGPGFFGATYSPFVIETDPVQPDFEVRDLNLNKDVSQRRFKLRRRLLRSAEKLGLKGKVGGRARTMTTYYQRALDLVTSPEAKKAFDLKAEPSKVRERYGYTSLGQCALLSRRLVEAGCRFIGIEHGSWDTHVDNFTSLEKGLCPSTDMAFSSLVSDLDQRGLLDDTLVVMWGEMGRTPRINGNAGRDHWAQCQSVLFAGGGIKRGAVIGASDKSAALPTTRPHSIQDVLRTILHLMGINGSKIYKTPLGRPVPLVNGGAVIRDIIA